MYNPKLLQVKLKLTTGDLRVSITFLIKIEKIAKVPLKSII